MRTKNSVGMSKFSPEHEFTLPARKSIKHPFLMTFLIRKNEVLSQIAHFKFCFVEVFSNFGFIFCFTPCSGPGRAKSRHR